MTNLSKESNLVRQEGLFILETKAVMRRKEARLEADDCVIEKVIHLPGETFDRFSSDLLADRDFIKDSLDSMFYKDGRYHCLLVIGEGRRDGILVDSSGYGYARHSAVLPNVHTFLTAERYPALAELNQRLGDIVDYLAQPTGAHYIFDLQDLETETGIDFMTNGALRSTILTMLDGRPEVGGFELDKNELTIYYSKDSLERAAGQKLERDSEEKPSVLEQIKAARQAPQEPKDEPPQTHKKAKGGPEL